MCRTPAMRLGDWSWRSRGTVPPLPTTTRHRRTKYERTYQLRAPHFVRLRIRARALVPTGLQPPPCYRSCSCLFAKFPYGSTLEHRLHHRFSTTLIASPGLPGIVAPSLRDNTKCHDQGMHFHSVDAISVNLITHRQYFYLQLCCLIAILINDNKTFLLQFHFLFKLFSSNIFIYFSSHPLSRF